MSRWFWKFKQTWLSFLFLISLKLNWAKRQHRFYVPCFPTSWTSRQVFFFFSPVFSSVFCTWHAPRPSSLPFSSVFLFSLRLFSLSLLLLSFFSLPTYSSLLFLLLFYLILSFIQPLFLFIFHRLMCNPLLLNGDMFKEGNWCIHFPPLINQPNLRKGLPITPLLMHTSIKLHQIVKRQYLIITHWRQSNQQSLSLYFFSSFPSHFPFFFYLFSIYLFFFFFLSLINHLDIIQLFYFPKLRIKCANSGQWSEELLNKW